MKPTTFFVATPLILVIAIFSYAYISKTSDRKEKLKRYREALKPSRDRNNPFYPQGALDFYDSLEAAHVGTGRGEQLLSYYKARTLITLGREKEAIALLENSLGAMEPILPGQDARLYLDMKKTLALSWLRWGERTNCLNSHTMSSCVFPITGDGVYTDPSASSKSILGYENILRENPEDLESRWLLNIAYMTIGRYPDAVPPSMLIPGLDKDSCSRPAKPFQEIAPLLGLCSSRHEAGGSIVDDFDNDGYLDIVTSSWDLEESLHFFHNNKDGTFTDASRSSGLADIKGGLDILQADYNNDGYTDILVLRGAWLAEFGNQPKTLLRNNGDGTFTDVTIESGILNYNPSQAATWADFNNDGWLDLFIGAETSPGKPLHPAELYINNRDGSFTNVAGQAGCDMAFFMKGTVAGDYDKDGWPDIFISGLDGKKILLRNKGLKEKIPQFEDVTHAAGLDKEATHTFPTWFFDYDNDGWPDIFVCGYQFKGGIAANAAAEALGLPRAGGRSKMYLYHNNHNGTFTEVTDQMGLDHPVFAMGANFGDIDNDGWPDMYLGTGNPDFASLVPNRLFRNLEGHGFEDVTTSARVGNLQKGHGVSFADLDNDGNQDIFTVIGGAYRADGYFNALYLNPGQDNGNNWISVLLKGTKTNRSAIGAHIAVRFHENGIARTVYMDVNSGGSFGCNALRKQIGIGKAKYIDELEITWPTSGTVQVFKNLTPRQYVTIEEGSDKIESQTLKRLNFTRYTARGKRDMSIPVSCNPLAK
jgi:hypothetical protein